MLLRCPGDQVNTERARNKILRLLQNLEGLANVLRPTPKHVCLSGRPFSQCHNGKLTTGRSDIIKHWKSEKAHTPRTRFYWMTRGEETTQTMPQWLDTRTRTWTDNQSPHTHTAEETEGDPTSMDETMHGMRQLELPGQQNWDKQIERVASHKQGQTNQRETQKAFLKITNENYKNKDEARTVSSKSRRWQTYRPMKWHTQQTVSHTNRRISNESLKITPSREICLPHLHEEAPRIRTMRGFPKIHKPPVPLRPITSGTGSTLHKLAKCQGELLTAFSGKSRNAYLKNNGPEGRITWSEVLQRKLCNTWYRIISHQCFSVWC